MCTRLAFLNGGSKGEARKLHRNLEAESTNQVRVRVEFLRVFEMDSTGNLLLADLSVSSRLYKGSNTSASTE